MNARTPLFVQCLSRLQFREAQEWATQAGNNHTKQQALRVQKIVQDNAKRDRIPPDLPVNLQTGIPDSYIDRVIDYLLREGPTVDALLAKQSETWVRVHSEVARMVIQYTSERCDLSGERFEELVKDLTQDCSVNIWRKLWRYPYDCDLSAWLSVFVKNMVRSACRKPPFGRSSSHLSLDDPSDDSPDGLLLAEVLPDDRAANWFEKADLLLTIHAGLRLLSKPQRALVEMQLGNHDNSEIAFYLDRTPNAIYTIRRRAVKKLHKFVISG
jgi:DNA-directed RNA polymerase specialized sigma24 family protein